MLFVEDEPKTGDYLKQGLTEAGCVADLTRVGRDGLHLATGGGYAFAERLARVRTLLRRSRVATEPTVLAVAVLELDLLRQRVVRAGRRIGLTPKEFALLELFVRHRGEVWPCTLIAFAVWGMDFDSDTNVVEVAVRRLRAKVDEGFEPTPIQTLRGMGDVLDVRQ